MVLGAAVVAGIGTVATTSPASSSPGQSTPETVAAAAPTSTPARTGRPTSIAVLGDSISTATGTGQLSAEMKQNSWVTGTVSWSMRGQLGIAGAAAYNQAANGRRMTDMASQATALPTTTQYVVVELGGNDLCRPSVGEMTPIASYRSQFRAGLAAIRARVPNALVLVASIPDIYNLWFIRGAPESVNPYVSDQVDQAGRAQFFWDNFLDIEVPCQSLLSNPTSLAAADIARRNQVRERNLAFNQVLADECGAVLRCRYDNNFFFNFSSNRAAPPNGPLLPRNQWGFEDRDISHNRHTGAIDWSGLCPVNFTYDGCGDHFHPSLIGQQKLAAAGTLASYQFDADTTPPAVVLTPSRAPDGADRYASEVTVDVSGTDAAGIRGYEVRVHQPNGSVSAWEQHVGAPPSITVAAEGQTWVEARALDVNGNLSASRSLGVHVDPDAFGQLSGTVTDDLSGAPVAGAWVAVLDRTSHAFVAGAAAGEDGRYQFTLEPGTYEAFIADPSARHAAEWLDDQTSQAASDTVAVAAGQVTAMDVGLAPAGRTAAIAGTITDESSGDPVEGAWAFAVTNGGVPTGGAMTDAAGAYEIASLPAGDYYVIMFDGSGERAVAFHDDATGFGDALLVSLDAGATAVVDADLAAAPGGAPPLTGGPTLVGQVTDSLSAQPIAGALVVAERAADFGFARAAITGGDGRYGIDLPAGDYKLVVIDPTLLHAMEWHENQPYHGIAESAAVTVPGTGAATVDAELDPSGPSGTITGTVGYAGGGSTEGAWVLAIDSTGNPAGGAVVGTDGTYTLGGLLTGSYLLAFVDPGGTHAVEFYDDATNPAESTLVTTNAGTSVSADAVLAPT